ncbi:MAG TPA: flagellar biosynthesis anti-sigma factor FlgM [Chthonomonadaceae bacterium]|nr:flagellar biosynthesis anti-sigma factor FlgM [Chthonomonadaceae bacterium]
MKISVEEVNRLLAFTPVERTGHRPVAGTPSQAQSVISEGQQAAQVEISPAAYEVQQVKKLIDELPDIREERVRELKAQIESGTYHVSGEDIADLIIRRALADNTTL